MKRKNPLAARMTANVAKTPEISTLHYNIKYI
jgi:hypothetical protein